MEGFGIQEVPNDIFGNIYRRALNNEDIATLSALQKMPSEQALAALPQTKFNSPLQYQQAQAIIDANQKKEAGPALQDFLTQYEAVTGTSDPRFMSDLANRQELAKAGLNIPTATQNPYLAKGVNDFVKQGQLSENYADVAKRIGNFEQLDPRVTANLIAMDEKAKDHIATLQSLAKQNEGYAQEAGLQKFLIGVGTTPGMTNDPKIATLYTAAQRGMKPADIENIAKNIGAVNEFKTVDTGINGTDQRQVVAFDPRTGRAVGQVGGTWANKPASTTVNIIDKTDAQGVGELLKDLPKLKTEHDTALSSNARLDKMIGLIDSGAAGSLGYAQSTIAPTLELMGIKSKGLTDAQMYQKLAAGLGGSMRTSIVGPGSVTNYEQQMLKAVSGGGMVGAEAAKELLNFYKAENEKKISNFNNTISAVEQVAPKTGAMYKRMQTQSPNIALAGNKPRFTLK